ncbi:ligand-binding sensor domain-containing protein [Emticicia sp. 17c]|uniref:ligand-binding sensor domain-containing protein n=1 Tax=Emticicia sp. 17c TaxID=3127704 RepID=UPI00301BBAD4
MKYFFGCFYGFVVSVIFVGLCAAQTDSVREIPVVAAQAKLIKPPLTSQHVFVRCIMQDKKGNMWFGTTGAGIYRYDGKTFTNFVETDGLINKIVYCLLEDNSGIIWASTEDGVYRYDGYKFRHFPLPGADNINYNFLSAKAYLRTHPYTRNRVYSMTQDKIGNIWFATANAGLYQYNGQYITNFQYIDNKWEIMPENSMGNKKNTCNNQVQYVFTDSKGKVWISTYEPSGLFQFNGKTFRNFGAEKHIKGNVFTINEDKNGKLWFNMDNMSVYSYNGETLTQFTEKDGAIMGYNTSASADNKGGMWFGGLYAKTPYKKEGYVYHYDGKNFSSFPVSSLESTYTWSVFVDRSGNLWIGAKNTSLYRYDGHVITDFSEKATKQ